MRVAMLLLVDAEWSPLKTTLSLWPNLALAKLFTTVMEGKAVVMSERYWDGLPGPFIGTRTFVHCPSKRVFPPDVVRGPDLLELVCAAASDAKLHSDSEVVIVGHGDMLEMMPYVGRAYVGMVRGEGDPIARTHAKWLEGPPVVRVGCEGFTWSIHERAPPKRLP